MIITQEMLIKQIAGKENKDIETIRKIFNATEDIIFNHLSSTTSAENITIKLLNGITLESKYISEQLSNKGIFKNRKIFGRIKVKSLVSKYYNRKINNT